MELNFNLGSVNYGLLATDNDIRREAKRLLPDAIKETAESLAVTTWELFVTEMDGRGVEIDHSQKAPFIRQAADDFIRNLGDSQRQEIEDCLVELIRANRDSGE